MEQVCDWILYRWTKWAVRKGVVEDKFKEGWIRKVSWNWPKMKDVDVVKEQNAIALKLKNQTGSYAEFYGADWEEKLLQIAKEKEFCAKHGLVHPSTQTVSGTVVDGQDEQDRQDDEEGKEEA